MKEIQLTKLCKNVSSSVKPYSGSRKYVDTGNISEFTIIGDTEYEYSKKPSRANKEVQKDDILFAKMKNTKKVLQITKNEEDFIFSTGLYVLSPNKEMILPRYVFHYFLTDNFHYLKDRFCVGGTQKAINDEGLGKLTIPIPESKIIQEKVVKILDKALEILQKRRKSIRLVDDLLNSTFVKIFGKPQLLLNNFEHKKLSSVADLKGGIAMCPERRMGTNMVSYLTVRNLYRDHFDYSDLRSINVSEDDLQKWHLEYGDLCVLEGGDKEDVGRTAVYQNQPSPCVHQNHIFRVRLDKDLLNPFFVSAYFNSDYMRAIFFRLAKATTGINTLNLTELGKVEIPIPAMAKQREFERSYVMIKHIQNSIMDETQLNILFKTLQLMSFNVELIH